jgi:hypothetical protein
MNIRTIVAADAPLHRRWLAIDQDTHDLGSPIGYGATEDAAISDLEAQLDAADEAAEAALDAACEWCNGTGWITVRARSTDYVCAGEPPEDATGVYGTRCYDCNSHYRQGRAA